MPGPWTHGTWIVKEGRENEFVEAWLTLARETLAVLPPPAPPTLLRDRARPNLFISFGPWTSDEDVERFRSSDAFVKAQTQMRDLLESFEPRTLDEVSR